MIIERLIDFFMVNFTFIIGLVSPIISGIDIPNDIAIQITDIIKSVAYFMPIVDLGIMIGIRIAVVNWHVLWRIVQRIWDALPLT